MNLKTESKEDNKSQDKKTSSKWKHPDLSNLKIEDSESEHPSKKVDLDIPVMEIMKALEEDEMEEHDYEQ